MFADYQSLADEWRSVAGGEHPMLLRPITSFRKPKPILVQVQLDKDLADQLVYCPLRSNYGLKGRL